MILDDHTEGSELGTAPAEGTIKRQKQFIIYRRIFLKQLF